MKVYVLLVNDDCSECDGATIVSVHNSYGDACLKYKKLAGDGMNYDIETWEVK